MIFTWLPIKTSYRMFFTIHFNFGQKTFVQGALVVILFQR